MSNEHPNEPVLAFDTVAPATRPAPIPIVQPTLPGWDVLGADFEAIVANPKITVGRYVRLLEEAVEQRTGARHAIAVSSCTSGLMLAVRALGVQGEAILPPYTWTSTGQCLLWNGVEPVFADIEPGRLTLDPDAFERSITGKTRAVLPVTVFGVPPEIDAIESIARRHGIAVIYDSAQGLGSTYRGRELGGFGDVEVFSMSPTKVATAVEGGLLTTNDDALAAKLRRMRDYGKSDDGDIDLLGLSARQSELHAAVGLRTVERLDGAIASRARLAGRYKERLEALPGVHFQTIPPHVSMGWNYVAIFLEEGVCALTAAELHDRLDARGIQSKRYFYRSLHQQTVFAAQRARSAGRLPIAEKASCEGLALPLYSHMGLETADSVADAVLEALK